MPVHAPRAAVRWPFAGPDDRAQRCGSSRRGQASTRQNWTICTIAVREVDEGLVRTDSALGANGSIGRQHGALTVSEESSGASGGRASPAGSTSTRPRAHHIRMILGVNGSRKLITYRPCHALVSIQLPPTLGRGRIVVPCQFRGRVCGRVHRRSSEGIWIFPEPGRNAIAGEQAAGEVLAGQRPESVCMDGCL